MSHRCPRRQGRGVWPETGTWSERSCPCPPSRNTAELTLLGRNSGSTVLVSFERFSYFHCSFLVKRILLKI